ncbi:GNAT family N-acetyltransferase [Roseivivax sp. GX 12232]|uniref:GNAT family N-acetyltransferase n=1 Tax=Roseivivax sp. GX 12232 TaxID=2900547 RepID=UPI001E4CACF6|nr:GNAT family N-acyltransferase [Roseivivax sp. GX 12232]MCE0506505.1 GNAT family N-acetyltransferase [Roseivivax sp. GX 12232]
MLTTAPRFRVALAQTEAEIRAAQRLRYEVFVAELGSTGALVDHAARLERDRFDPVFDHLLLFDDARPEAPVVGVYRLLTEAGAAQIGQFYSEDEYDLAPLRASGRRLLELGRSCLHRDYRGGAGVMLLWQGLADYVQARGIELLFGVASFHGTDPEDLAQPLSNLHYRHLAPEALRVRSRQFQPMDLLPEAAIDRPRAVRETPALIKGYLRLGGMVGEGAFIDRAFNTVDICLVMDTAALDPKRRALYAEGRT